MLPILQIGGLSIRTPMLPLFAAIWIGLEFASRRGMRRGIHGDHVYNIGFYGLIAGILGSRLAFVISHLNLYTDITPITRVLTSVFALATGTEIGWAGILIGLSTAAYLTYRWQVDPLQLADAFAPAVAIFAIGAGVANLLSGDYYGVPGQVPWAIDLWGAMRHPTQLYLVLAGTAALYVALKLQQEDQPTGKRSGKAKKRVKERRTRQADRPTGFAIQTVLAILASGILLIEPLRADSPVIGPGIRVWMVIGVVILVGVMAGFAYRAPTGEKQA